LIELADADHEVLAKEVVKFEVPRPSAQGKPMTKHLREARTLLETLKK